MQHHDLSLPDGQRGEGTSDIDAVARQLCHLRNASCSARGRCGIARLPESVRRDSERDRADPRLRVVVGRNLRPPGHQPNERLLHDVFGLGSTARDEREHLNQPAVTRRIQIARISGDIRRSARPARRRTAALMPVTPPSGPSGSTSIDQILDPKKSRRRERYVSSLQVVPGAGYFSDTTNVFTTASTQLDCRNAVWPSPS